MLRAPCGGMLCVATGCKQIESVVGVANNAFRNSLASAVTDLVGGVLDSTVVGMIDSNAG